MYLYRAGVLLLALGSSGSAQEQEGYRLTPTQVVIDRAAHWRAWEGATGTYQIYPDGAVQPYFLRRQTNALLDASQFETVVSEGDTVRGGLRAAGSNIQTAALVLDGNANTFWEPNITDSLEQWFVEIDLGRTVIAQQVRVRFADEGEGDPFLKFRVLLSDGQEGSGAQRRLQYFRVGQVAVPNKDQREFVFAVKPQRPLPEGMSGEPVQILRFEALGTDGPRGFAVTPEQYLALDPLDQGAIDYYRQTVSGRTLLIDQQTYGDLPAEEQGPIRHFRRERPRLAEIEVLTPGDNIVHLTQHLLIRQTDLFANILLILATDGFFRSRYAMRVYDPIQERYQLEIDLGAKFWLDHIRLLSAENPLKAYQLRVSDGSLDPAGSLVWTVFDERLNRESFLQVEEPFPLQEVRFIDLRRLELVGAPREDATLSEVQAYGEGYVSEVTLTSPLIRLGRSRMFTSVDWEGEVPGDTRIELRTRSGDDLLKISRYFDVIGREISQQQWESASARNKGPVVEDEIPGPKWSNWSETYEQSGQGFRSPSPRQYALAQVRLLTRNPQRSALLRSLRLGLAPPLVDQVFAEVWPVRGVQPGVDQEFSLYLKPVFAARDSGFDRIRLRSSSSAPLQLVSLRSGQQSLWPGAAQLEESADGSIEVVLPRPVTSGSAVYTATFRTQVYLSGTTFSAELSRATRPGVVQSASEGEASAQVPSQSLVVTADLVSASLLEAVAVVPSIFTPNNDGINDQTRVQFSVFRLKGEHLLKVEVFDLQGHRVRDLSVVRQHPSGAHALPWDGRDETGNLVVPGIYLVRVGFATDAAAAGTQAVRLVHVVY